MSAAALSRITFVGIGVIGLPMAEQLVKAGFDVTGVDPSPEQRKKAELLGIRSMKSCDSAAAADVVICMVATPDQMQCALLGEHGALQYMRPGSVLLLMSTVGPDAVRTVAQRAPSGVQVLDVPVTGGVSGAIRGQLTLFAAGNPGAVKDVEAVLQALGTVVDCGADVGQGQSYKLVNQLLCSVHIVAAAEALAFAQQLGLDMNRVLPAVAGGAGGSWMLSDRGPRMLVGLEAEVNSTIGIFVKDSTLVSEAAETLGFAAPVLAAARARFTAARDAGWDGKDDSQVIQTYLQQASGWGP